MYRLPCLRTLDRPILIFGLEPEDMIVTLAIAAILMFVADPIVGVIAGVVLWVALKKVKGGKSPGFLYALLYRCGILSITPSILRVPHLVRAPGPGPVRHVRLSGICGDADEESAQFRYYHHEKSRLS